MYDEVKEDDFSSTSSSKNAVHKEQFVRASVEEGKLAQDGDGCRFTATIIVSGAVGNVHVARTYVSVAENYCSSYDRAIRISTTRVTSFTAHPLASPNLMSLPSPVSQCSVRVCGVQCSWLIECYQLTLPSV